MAIPTYKQQLVAAPTTLVYAVATNGLSSINLRGQATLDNANNVLAYNVSGLGTPAVSAGSAIQIATSWGDTVEVGVYHNYNGPVTFILADKQTRNIDTVTLRFAATHAVSAYSKVNTARGGAWYPEYARMRNLGYI